MQSDRREKLDGRDEGKHWARYGARGDRVSITDSDTSPMRERYTGSGKAALALRQRICNATATSSWKGKWTSTVLHWY
jgi:hypothetical protein